MVYTLGVDIALRKSGIVLVDSSGEIVFNDMMVISPKYEYTEAIFKIYENMTKVYNFIESKFSPEKTTVVMEDVAGFVHVKAALAIHAARTSAVLAYHNSHLSKKEIVYHTPNVVKHWVAGQRGAKKDAVLSSMKSKFPQYNYEVLKEDEIDALALALYHQKGVYVEKAAVSGTKRRRISKGT